jgi:putative photosynthetic complex assembly protein 2
VLFALGVWWVSTGVILYLNGLPRATFRTTLGVATAVTVGAFWGLRQSSGDTGAAGAYCAFSCALLVWAWQELAFLLGVVTGPRRSPCPPDAVGWQRTKLAFLTVLHHELALVVLGLVVWVAVGDGANRIGWWTYVALWAMRQSAKLNLFLGARNLSEAFLPEHLRYLHTYFRRRAMNPLFPLSILATTGAAVWVWQQLAALPAGSPALAGQALLGTLLALGALEHALLVLPLPPEALWRWGLRSRKPATVGATAPLPLAVATAPPPCAPRPALVGTKR